MVAGSVNSLLFRALAAKNKPAEQQSTSRVPYLEDILTQYFQPELDRLQSDRSALERMFLERLTTPADLHRYRTDLEALGNTLASDLFGPGGTVERAYGQALGRSVESGLGTTSGSFARARQNILLGARDQISKTIGQNILGLVPVVEQSRGADLAALLDYVNRQSDRLEGLRESMFTGRAGIAQLGLAEQTMDMNRRILDSLLRRQRSGGLGGFLKSTFGTIAGGLLGSIVPGVGTAVGTAIGQRLSRKIG